MSEYDDQATQFLDRFGVRISIKEGEGRCPPWQEGACSHGDQYRIRVSKDGRSLVFPYWGSYNDMQAGVSPSNYDILSTLGSDSSSPDSVDEYIAEYGMEIKSEKDYRQIKSGISFGERIRAFFTEEELDALREIQ